MREIDSVGDRQNRRRERLTQVGNERDREKDWLRKGKKERWVGERN